MIEFLAYRPAPPRGSKRADVEPSAKSQALGEDPEQRPMTLLDQDIGRDRQMFQMKKR
jgi:hypothetical protein